MVCWKYAISVLQDLFKKTQLQYIQIMFPQDGIDLQSF